MNPTALRRSAFLLVCCAQLAACGGRTDASTSSNATPLVVVSPGAILDGACPAAPAPAAETKPPPISADSAPTRYNVAAIAPLTQHGEARAVNANGDIAGQLNGAAFVCHDGRITKFPGYQYFYLDGPYTSIATSINDQGVAAGHDGSYRPCSMSGLEFATAVRFRNGKMEFVDRARDGRCSFEVDGINDAGVIVGENAFRGFVRYPDGSEIEVKPLSTRPENNGTRASAIANDGHVVGGTTVDVTHLPYIDMGVSIRPGHTPEAMRAPDPNAYVIHAFVATFANGSQQMRDLGALPGYPDTYATAINDDLTVVGYSGTKSAPKWTVVSGPSHAWVWQHGRMIDLGAEDMASTFAYAVNDAGIIVGCSGSDAVRWVDHRFADLNDLIGADSGWHLTCARGINSAGVIVGVGTYEDQPRPFRLVPVNEPLPSTGGTP
jgi:probable HAF family extracellular repeat protein